MMGKSDPQPGLYYNISLESFVPADHPLRAIRPLIDDAMIRKACRKLYSEVGRPSIPPEQLLRALVGGCLLGAGSDRKIGPAPFRWTVLGLCPGLRLQYLRMPSPPLGVIHMRPKAVPNRPAARALVGNPRRALW